MLHKILTGILFVIITFTAKSQLIHGDVQVVQGSTTTYSLDPSVYNAMLASQGNWSIQEIDTDPTDPPPTQNPFQNIIISGVNTSLANGAVSITIEWNVNYNVSTFCTLKFEGSDNSYFLNIEVLTIPDALKRCTTIAPLYQLVTIYQQSPAPLDVTSCALNTTIPYSVEYTWEVSVRNDEFYTANNLKYEDYSWTSVAGNPATANLDPAPLDQSGTVLYVCKITVTYGSQSNTAEIYTSIARIESPKFSTGFIYHNTSYTPGMGNIVGVASGTAILPILQDPSQGGLCANKTYTWQIWKEGDNFWQDLFAGSSSPSWPANFQLPITKYTEIRRKVECLWGEESGEDHLLYSNVLKYDISYTSQYTENKNYIRINELMKPGVNTWAQADQLVIGDKLQSTAYFDGFYRTVQKVDKETSSNNGIWKDFVTHIEYDEAGRTPKQYLSYPASTTTVPVGFFKTDAATDQPAVIRNYYAESSTANTWAEIKYEESPLNRPENVRASGTGWSNSTDYKGIDAAYTFNTDASTTQEQIVKWDIGYSLTDVPQTSGYYPLGVLTKKISIDEKNKRVIQYTDKYGNLILKKVEVESNADEYLYEKWLSTYYVYDDFGRLRFVIPPKATTFFRDHGWNIASNLEVASELCFYYHYDEKGRTIVKHAPGAGEIHLVYDERDRLIFSQDQKQRDRYQQWSFTFYDEFDRIVATGLVNKNENRENLQAGINNKTTRDIKDIKIAINNSTETITIHAYGSYQNGTEVYNTFTIYDDINNYLLHHNYVNYNIPSQANVTYPQTSDLTFRTNGMVMGSVVRIIDANNNDNDPSNDKFMKATNFYDENGRLFQRHDENIKGGEDIASFGFDFIGKVSGIVRKKNVPGTAYTNFITNTYHTYDKLGRVTAVFSNYNNTGYKKISSIDYDPFGRIKNKKLSPAYNSNNGIESLSYDYNIHGWLTGINKQYALTTNNADQWDHYFGISLGYLSNSNQFTQSQYNGMITGAVWKTQGDNKPKKFDYTYDAAGRYTGATFHEKEVPSANWTNSLVDYSVSDILYDENGNLLTLKRKGMIPGIHHGEVIDNLEYHYVKINGVELGNRLAKVIDLATSNQLPGDFKDGSNSGDDYTYDENGNLTNDENKTIRDPHNGDGITWNYMDKPQRIVKETSTSAANSRIDYIYDASGTKLAKTVSKTDYNNVTTAVTSWYMGEFLFEDKNGAALELQYIQHEEGRIRLVTPKNTFGTEIPAMEISGGIAMPGNKIGVFDWFIKDHQGNTRMTLTEEVHKEMHVCTMEDENQGVQEYEEHTFGKVDAHGTIPSNNEVVMTRVDVPGDWKENTSHRASKLRGPEEEKMVGPSILLKVMAGDIIDAKTDYYFKERMQSSSGQQGLMEDVINTLLLNVGMVNGNVTNGVKSNLTGVANNNFGGTSFHEFLASQAQGSDVPKAYLTWMFFDENFNFIDLQNGSGSLRVSEEGDRAHPLVANGLKAPQNGYVFVYVGNESPEQAVWFDNLIVKHTRGRILQEDHYYPGGMKMVGLCAKAFNKLDNNFGYQGEYSEEEDESEYSEFDLRLYDAQIERWTSTDPYDQFASPYVGMGNDPVNNVDPDGGFVGIGQILRPICMEFESYGSLGTALANTFLSSSIGAIFGSAVGMAQRLGSGVGELPNGIGKNKDGNSDDNNLNKGGDGNNANDGEYYMIFEGKSKRVNEGTSKNPIWRQEGTGKLKVYRKGKSEPIDEFDASSGPGGNGLLPNGDYEILNNREKDINFHDESGNNYKYRLRYSKSVSTRPDFEVHPMVNWIAGYDKKDCKPNWGRHSTNEGCIGLMGGWAEVERFDQLIQSVFVQNGSKPVRITVKIEGNGQVRNSIEGQSDYQK